MTTILFTAQALFLTSETHNYQLSILIMITVMSWQPISPTYVAKLESTPAFQMIASLIFLYHKFALLALTIVQVTLKELKLMSITVSFVLQQQTFLTKLIIADIADHRVLHVIFNKSFAILSWAKFYRWIVCINIKSMKLVVVFLYVERKLFKKLSIYIQQYITLLPRTINFLEGFNFIDDIVMETGLTKVELMLAIAHIRLFVRFLERSFANFTIHNAPNIMNFTINQTSNLRIFEN